MNRADAPFRVCYVCQTWYPKEGFAKDASRCKACQKQYMFEWKMANKDKMKANNILYRSSVIGRADALWRSAMNRAKIKDREFTLTREHVINGLSLGFCCKTFYPFDFTVGKSDKFRINPYAPSIDKIDPNGIYEADNVQYVCTLYNFAKGQNSEAVLIDFCKRVAEINR